MVENASLQFDFSNQVFVVSVTVMGPIILILNGTILVSIILIMVKGEDKPRSYIVLGNICFANLVSVITELIVTCKSAADKLEYQPDAVERGFLLSSNMASMWSICLVALDRLIYIVYAIQYERMISGRVVGCVTLLTWCIGWLIGVIPAAYLDSTVFSQDGGGFRVTVLLVIQVVTSTFIALVILLTYLTLYIIYRRKIVGRQKTMLTMRYTFKATVMAMLSCASFVVSWEPFLVSIIIYYSACSRLDAGRPLCRQISSTVVSPLPITSLLNALFNPTAYIWWHRPFIQDLKHVFCTNRLREEKRHQFISEIQQSQSDCPYISTYL